MSATVDAAARPGLAPFSLRDAPSFIERQFPVGRLSAEAYKERKAVAGQTLTALGSYWKGRKPLILVRAVVLGCLLPATDDAAADLDIFLKLMAMDDGAFGRRYDGSAGDFARLFPLLARGVATNLRIVWRKDADPATRKRATDAEDFARRFPDEAALATEMLEGTWRWRGDLDDEVRRDRIAEAFATLPYKDRLKAVRRPEECDEEKLLAPIWSEVNRHIGTRAHALPQLIEQIGLARFGHRPKVADTFCGGGSIPFEAARIGCDVFASDLNPIACMQTWGAFNIIGGGKRARAKIKEAQETIVTAVDAEVKRLGIEQDEAGNHAKAYLYCLETRCPKTGWMVPLVPSWVISKTRAVIGRLRPRPDTKTYEIEVLTGVSGKELTAAEMGTLQGGRVVHPMNSEKSGVAIEVIRGDLRDLNGNQKNRLRQWQLDDVSPRPDDVFQERLYCVQWVEKEEISNSKPSTFFSAASNFDLAQEVFIRNELQNSLSELQRSGYIPDAAIVSGKENEGPIRTNGWTHWHHLFMPRALLTASLISRSDNFLAKFMLLKYLDNNSKSCRWAVSQSGGDGGAKSTFDSQALKTIFNWANRSLRFTPLLLEINDRAPVLTLPEIVSTPADRIETQADLFLTDPPYADAVRYEEITEFFIAWLRRRPSEPFEDWSWDSHRELAIQGKDERFRRGMVAAYSAMTRLMPENGMQVVMFTHQDADVWADLGGILWAAGLRVAAAWNIATETESALKEGNYVQGTVCLALRKRAGEANARRMEIEAEIEEEVAAQIARLSALDDTWHERSNAESLYTDGDLTLAAYAAALQVVTAYSSIDRQPLDRDLYRKVRKGETTMLRELVDYAAQVANGLLVPEGFPRDMWRDLVASERFYVRMLDMEAKGATQVADFQNFAKSFAFGDYASLMESTAANAASLAGAADLKGRMLDGDGFAKTLLRQVLFAVWKTMEGDARDPKRGVTILKTEYAADYWQRRQKLIALASYVALKTKTTRPDESAAAEELAEALKLDRV